MKKLLFKELKAWCKVAKAKVIFKKCAETERNGIIKVYFRGELVEAHSHIDRLNIYLKRVITPLFLD
ncbi:MAG: hypothetical protein WCK96_04030 [Methylococcales bacterium]